MKLVINQDSSLGSIQKQFNACYPFLKIEFYSRVPESEMGKPVRTLSNTNRVHQCKSCGACSCINIGSETRVADLEQELEKRLGLVAHVLRKSGNVWVTTMFTNEWSLKDQNEEGKQISSHFINNNNSHTG